MEKAIFFEGFLISSQKNAVVEAWVYSPQSLKKGQRLEILELSPEGFVLQERSRRKALVKVEAVQGQKVFLRFTGRPLKLPRFSKVRRPIKDDGEIPTWDQSWAVSLGLGTSAVETSVGSRLHVLDHDLSPAPALFISVDKGFWSGRGAFAIGDREGASVYILQSLLTYSRSWRKWRRFFSQWSVGGAYDSYLGDVPGRLSWQKFSPLVGGSVKALVFPKLVQFHQVLLGWPVMGDPANEWLSSFSFQYRGEARWMMQRNQALVAALGLKKEQSSFSLGSVSQWGWQLGLSLQRRF